MYVPKNPSGVKRIILDFTFLLAAAFQLISLSKKPKYDAIITVVPSFLIGILGVIYKKFNPTNLVYHVQDLQIEAARDLNMIKNKSLIDWMFKIEKYILKNCNIVTCVGDGMARIIQPKVKKAVQLFLNPVDSKLIYPIHHKDELKVKYGFKSSDTILLYSGAIGEKQGIEAILYAAKEFEKLNNLCFVICGSGPYKVRLQALAESLGLKNVRFLPLQPSASFNEFLNVADIHFVIQKANASDLVMPSKLAAILAVGGVAIITANEGSSLHDLVTRYDLAVLAEAENQEALNDSIKKALFNDNTQIKRNARQYAEEALEREVVMKKFEQLLFKNAQVGQATLP